jgi:hypothetical protein
VMGVMADNKRCSDGGKGGVRTAWACTVCTFENPMNKSACKMCGRTKANPSNSLSACAAAPAPPAARQAAAGGGGGGGEVGEIGRAGEAGGTGEDVDWSCKVCTFANPVNKSACKMCGRAREWRGGEVLRPSPGGSRRAREVGIGGGGGKKKRKKKGGTGSGSEAIATFFQKPG